MSINLSDQGMPSLDGIVYRDAVLPSPVFIRKFSRYFFFDLDIATSLELAEELQRKIKDYCENRELIEIFFADSRLHFATLVMSHDWPHMLLEVGQQLRNSGNCGGLILMPASGKWLLFQSRPVDIGVLAINCAGHSNERELDESACFFDCEDIVQWMSGCTKRDLNLRENFGEWLLRGLVENYCTC